MIVVCTACTAKFRIADHKVGPRGIRLRCSKCQNVFTVRRGGDAAQAPPAPPPAPRIFEVDLDDAGRGRAAAEAPPAPQPADPFARPDDPFAASAFADPFAAGAAKVDPLEHQPPSDPFAEPAAAALRASMPPADPFSDGLALAGGAASPLLDDPFTALGAMPDPAAHAAPPSPLVTDLSGLDIGPATTSPSAVPPPLPNRAAAAVSAAPGPKGPASGLALEERTPAGGLRGLEALQSSESDELPLDRGDFGAREPAQPAPSADRPPAAPPHAASAPPPAVSRRPPPAPGEEKRAAGSLRGEGRLHALVVNSTSLGILLALAVGLFMVLRGEGHLPAGRLVRAGRGAAVVATQVSSGLYPAARGRLVLFVRGQIRVQGSSPLGPVTVRAEIWKGEQVVAAAESLAGAVPSAEEVASIGAAADAERLRALLAARAPKQVHPGEALPFLVVFSEYPDDLGDVTLRVVADAAPATGPG